MLHTFHSTGLHEMKYEVLHTVQSLVHRSHSINLKHPELRIKNTAVLPMHYKQAMCTRSALRESTTAGQETLGPLFYRKWSPKKVGLELKILKSYDQVAEEK